MSEGNLRKGLTGGLMRGLRKNLGRSREILERISEIGSEGGAEKTLR